MKSKAKYYDSPDLRENFKKKPEQLDNVFKNADKIVCSVTKATLWGVPEYTKENEAELHRLREKKRSLETAGTMKRAKKPAAPKKQAKKKEGEANEEADASKVEGTEEKEGLSPQQKKVYGKGARELQSCGKVAW